MAGGDVSELPQPFGWDMYRCCFIGVWRVAGMIGRTTRLRLEREVEDIFCCPEWKYKAGRKSRDALLRRGALAEPGTPVSRQSGTPDHLAWAGQANPLTDGGVTIAMGTDSGTSLGRWQGYFEHVELELMVMTPMQALVAATRNSARVMRLDELGTLESGKWADLVVLAGRHHQTRTRCGSPAGGWRGASAGSTARRPARRRRSRRDSRPRCRHWRCGGCGIRQSIPVRAG